MKKIFSVLLAATLLLCCILPASAVSASEGDSLRGEITFETVTLGGKAMTIPVLVQDKFMVRILPAAPKWENRKSHTIYQ